MRGSIISNQKWVSGCFSLTNQSQAFPNFEITMLEIMKNALNVSF
jgi:hypothetical protein